MKKTVKHGGGTVIVSRTISAALVRLCGKINGEVYKQILRQHALPYLRNANIENTIFMQDNAPCHTCKTCKPFFIEERVDEMGWPAQSPVLNPKENVWKIIRERAHQKKYEKKTRKTL